MREKRWDCFALFAENSFFFLPSVSPFLYAQLATLQANAARAHLPLFSRCAIFFFPLEQINYLHVRPGKRDDAKERERNSSDSSFVSKSFFALPIIDGVDKSPTCLPPADSSRWQLNDLFCVAKLLRDDTPSASAERGREEDEQIDQHASLCASFKCYFFAFSSSRS